MPEKSLTEVTIDRTKDSIEDLRKLNAEIETAADNLIPILRSYLDEVRRMRMAFTTEVREVLRTSVELATISKNNQELRDFAVSIRMIIQALENENINRLEKLFKKE